MGAAGNISVILILTLFSGSISTKLLNLFICWLLSHVVKPFFIRFDILFLRFDFLDNQNGYL